MSVRPPRAPAAAAAAAARDGDDDGGALVHALRRAPSRLLRTLPPAASPAPGGLDAVLLRGVALVAYAAGGAAVIARGADLGVLRVLRGAACGAGGEECAAVAFRARDGALAAAFGSEVVVFEGWSAAAELRGVVYDERCIVARARVDGGKVCALSWSGDGGRLASTGGGAVVWALDDGGGGARVGAAVTATGAGPALSGNKDAVCGLRVVREWMPPGLAAGARLDIGVLSPDGALLAGAAMHARVGWVWTVDPPNADGGGACGGSGRGGASPSSPRLLAGGAKPAELVFGWEGVAAMQWKLRGGGGPSLMTVDRDGSLRLWARVLAAAGAAASDSDTQGRLDDGSSWMEEVARSPHVETSVRAGAAFVQWGGGGGVADDESDAAATAAAHPFVAGGAAPKPSRALHWVVCVAGGDCRAWRVRGLDDRPRPEFARLEPGSGHALVIGTEHHMYGEEDEDLSNVDSEDGGHMSDSTRDERRRRRRRKQFEQAGVSLEGADVAATRALAPVPLTTSSSRRIGLVKSYATSNGERRLRSAEPPGPPTIASVFVLLTRDGAAHVARYDMSPTSDAPAACRACTGSGHSSPVAELIGIPLSFNASAAAVAGSSALATSLATSWLLSQGVGGDVLLWRADPASPTREPLVLAARLPGPHSAASFSPLGFVASRQQDNSAAVFGVDAITGALHLYILPDRGERNVASSSVQNVVPASRIASCMSGNTTGEAVSLLVPVPLARRRNASDACLLLGFAGNGRACCWRVSQPLTRSRAQFEPVIMRFDGRRFGTVTAADTAIEFGTSTRLLALGSSEGCVRLFEIIDALEGDDVESLLADEDVKEDILDTGLRDESQSDGDSRNEDDDGDDGIARFREVAFLVEKDGSQAGVRHVCIMAGGERVAVLRNDGSSALWERASAGDCIWRVVLSIPSLSQGVELPLVEGNSVEAASSTSKRSGGLSFSRDVAGQLVLYVSRNGLDVDLYRKPHGTQWEKSVVVPAEDGPSAPGPFLHIGQGVLVVGSGDGMLVYEGSSLADGKAYGASNGAGYSPPRNLLAHLMSGGLAWQTIAALEELCAYVEKSSVRVMSSSSYAAGRGLAPPPPPLSAMISSSDSPALHQAAPASARTSDSTVDEKATMPALCAYPKSTKRNIFEELMAKSEAQFATELPSNSNAAVSFDLGEDEANMHKLVKLSKRLRVVSLAGLSRSEQNVLSALALACSRVEGIITTLDATGARFALVATTFLLSSSARGIPIAAVAAAVHSSAADALSEHFLLSETSSVTASSEPKSALGRGRRTRAAAASEQEIVASLYATARRLGAGWWISTQAGAKALVERIARTEYSTSRDADTAALWYIALGRVKPLAALYRAQQDLRMATFLSRNFRENANKVAAGKNAYVLVSKQRHHLAVGFFILAGDYTGALALVRSRLNDDQLAVILARVLDDGRYVETTLDAILTSPEVHSDPHLHAIVLWLRGRHIEALEVITDSHVISQGEVAAHAHSGEMALALGEGLAPAALALGHLIALADRPPIRGTTGAIRALGDWRERAMHALTAEGSPVSALRIGLSLLDGASPSGGSNVMPTSSMDLASSVLSRAQRISVTTRVISAAAVSLKERAVAASRSVRSGAARVDLLTLTEVDLRDLSGTTFGVAKSVRAACSAAAELARIDEVDAAVALSLAALRLSQDLCGGTGVVRRLAERHVLYSCYLASGRSVSRSLCALSPLHKPDASAAELRELELKMKAAIRTLRKWGDLASEGSLDQVLDAMNRGTLVLTSASAYMRGDWSCLLAVLRSCEEPPASLRIGAMAGEEQSHGEDADAEEDNISKRSTSSLLAPESISLEGLRHMASNPAVLGLSPRIGHRRRHRRAPSLAIADHDGASAAVTMDESSSGQTPGPFSSNDPIEFIRAHPALNSALGSAAVSYLTSHQAARSASLLSHVLKSVPAQKRVPGLRANLTRLQEVSEAFEHVAADSIAGWTPLVQFGVESREADGLASTTEEAAGAFIDLWCALGSLPEYAPTLSEAATVAAAEVASAAAELAAADQDAASVRSARRRRKGRMVTSSSTGGFVGGSKSSDIFDTTSADSLFGAYPVRFSAVAKGPWSGRGHYARLYSEETALFRTLCISSSDPPAVVVATPRGIQEVVPSSYTTMPKGFRSHYFAKRKRTVGTKSGKEHGASPFVSGDIPAIASESIEAIGDEPMLEDDLMHIGAAFGEGGYRALDMSADAEGSNSSKRSSYSSSGKDTLWRHQVQATALAPHPLRRRFASGGNDGVVRLWDFGDPVSLGALRCRQLGRVSAVNFSVYGNALVSVHVSGHVALWQDPESCMSQSGASRRDVRGLSVVKAFQNRNASDVVFLDERFTIAAVGDPTSPPAVGHGLRVYDTREANAAFHSSWSARVHNGGEARCLALLEDRVRVVTGGVDGSLSVVDLRMARGLAAGGGVQARVAELPAHDDEVTCLTLESPRGRALVSGCRNGDIKLWDARTLLQLDHLPAAHTQTRHYWSGNGLGGMVGSYGVTSVVLTDRSLISCGGDGVLKVWGPGYSTSDLSVV